MERGYSSSVAHGRNSNHIDIVISLTGRRQHGKDTIAAIATEQFGCDGIVALADWFKRVLSDSLKIPLERFYLAEYKDAQLARPIILDRIMLKNWVRRLADIGYEDWATIALSKYYGRQFDTLRDLMIWFGNEFVNNNCGNTLHCDILLKDLRAKFAKLTHKQIGVYVVTDARLYAQSKYIGDNFEDGRNSFVYNIKVFRPDGPVDNNAIENAVDLFPENYFFDTIVNNGDEEALQGRVKEVFDSILQDVKRRVGNMATTTSPSVEVSRPGVVDNFASLSYEEKKALLKKKEQEAASASASEKPKRGRKRKEATDEDAASENTEDVQS